MNNLTLKDITIKNIKELQELYQVVNWRQYGIDSKCISDMLRYSTYFLGAFINNHLIGFIRGFSDNCSINFIQDLIVHPNYQRQGIGSKLVNEILHRFSNVQKTVLLTDHEEKQKLFYESLGFEDLHKESSLCCFIKLKE